MDGLHPLVSIFQPTALADEVTMEPASPAEIVALARAESRGDAPPVRDVVVCPDVPGENLALTALTEFRAATGWDGPPQRVTIVKRIPIAGGMAGGSADAAASLRLVSETSGIPIPDELPMRLGADVPALLADTRALVTGAGEHVERVGGATPTLVIVPLDAHLSTAAVYAEFDARDRPRATEELDHWAERLRGGEPPPAVNDLQAAARRLCPAIDDALEALAAAGVQRPLVTGSGPTVFGFSDDPEAPARLRAAGYARARSADPYGP
jgi:4-diphosphocytidyl-2-C-methyl-D-erythritol kinase